MPATPNGPNRAPADRKDVFPLLELLERLPGVFGENLLGALEPYNKATLALTCTALRKHVQQSARSLCLRKGSCCFSRVHQLSVHLPNISHLVLKPGNLHEAMFVAPLFFVQDARYMTGITSLQLHDLLPDRPPEEVQCGSCSAWAYTYDLSAILATAAQCLPALKALDFATHYISDAECAAISLMTGLTRLQLRSTHGTHVDGLSRMISLDRLAHLVLLDRMHTSRASPLDVSMILGRSHLTHLELGHHALVLPLLDCLAEMASEDWQARVAQEQQPQQQRSATAAAGGAQPQQQRLNSSSSSNRGLAATHAATRVSTAAAAAFGHALGGLATAHLEQRQPDGVPRLQQLLQPPPLASLSVVLRPGSQSRLQAMFSSTCSLTQLTHLSLGWMPSPEHHHIHLEQAQTALQPDVPLAAQQQLSSLLGLQQLALGWTPQPELLGALAFLTRLTELQLGGLFSALPEPPPVGQLRLPSVQRLTVQMETPLSVLQAATDPADAEPLAHGSCIAALAAFPGLTRLELCGRLYGAALAHLPHVAPREGLRELLLPQRLAAVSFADLAAVRQLRGLTHLRLGWRSACHEGPAGYRPLPWGADAVAHDGAAAAGGEDAQQQQAVALGGAEAANHQHGGGPQQQQQQPPTVRQRHASLSALTYLAPLNQMQGGGTAVSLQLASSQMTAPLPARYYIPWQPSLQLPQLLGTNSSTGSGLAGVNSISSMPPPAAVAAAAGGGSGMLSAGSNITVNGSLINGSLNGNSSSSLTAAPAAGQPVPCSTCGASAAAGCLCRLRSLEVVGPLPPSELPHLLGLPALRRLVLKSNDSWSTGLHPDELLALAPHLTLLELVKCEGLEPQQLEHQLLLMQQSNDNRHTNGSRNASQTPAASAAITAAGGTGAMASPSNKVYHGPNVVVGPRHEGLRASDLGRGYPFMGVVLTRQEELGLLPDEVTGPTFSSEHLAADEPEVEPGGLHQPWDLPMLFPMFAPGPQMQGPHNDFPLDWGEMLIPFEPADLAAFDAVPVPVPALEAIPEADGEGEPEPDGAGPAGQLQELPVDNEGDVEADGQGLGSDEEDQEVLQQELQPGAAHQPPQLALAIHQEEAADLEDVVEQLQQQEQQEPDGLLQGQHSVA